MIKTAFTTFSINRTFRMQIGCFVLSPALCSIANINSKKLYKRALPFKEDKRTLPVCIKVKIDAATRAVIVTVVNLKHSKF